MEQKKNARGTVLTAVVLTLLLGLGAVNIPLLSEPVRALRSGETDFRGFTEAVQTAYTSGFFGKNALIDLNGLFARMTGRQICNRVTRLKNGMLTTPYSSCDVTPLAEGITELEAYLRSEGIPFLYVQAPQKVDTGKTLLREGVTDFSNENADALLTLLKGSGVETLDLRPAISSTPEQIGQYYFRTDHHWNFTGAFVGFQQLVDRLDTLLPGAALDKTYASMDQWVSHTQENAFLGSQGKRTGRFYGGVDDVTYYTPGFETTMSCAIPRHRALFKGDFAEANIRGDYLTEKPDYFAQNPYAMYIGGDYPLVKHRNSSAPNDLRVLMLKDSYTLPVQAYLSTVVKELDVVDPRHFTEFTVAEYAAQFRPDAVVLMMNPSTFGEAGYADPGVEQAKKYEEQALRQVLPPADVEIQAADSTYNCTAYTTGLEPGKTYELRFADVCFTAGSAHGVAAALYEPETKRVLSSEVFDVAYCQENGGFCWQFRTPEEAGDLQLLLYSGVPGTTQGVGTRYSGVELLRAG